MSLAIASGCDRLSGMIAFGIVAQATAIWQPAWALKTPRLISVAIVLAIIASFPVRVRAAFDSRTAVYVECHCPDPVGAGFCAAFKQKVIAAPGYRLVSNSTSGYGIGVHFSSVDLWQGINVGMAGRITAVSVAFTIYAERLPGEVYADSSVFRVGKDTFPEMTSKIIGALGQIVNLNAALFDKMRTESMQTPAPASLKPIPSP
jgi:hypothetical protein